MQLIPGVRLATLTTLRLGGPAARFVEASTEGEVVTAVRAADAGGEPVLLLGGGSNLVVSDAGWPGVVVALRWRGVSVQRDGDRVAVTVRAGEPWDALVDRSAVEGWSGLECLAGIPGLTGATPVQNVGAYGQEVAEVIAAVVVWDRQRAIRRELPAAECGFAYRSSIFKHTDRYVVLAVRFTLAASPRSAPIRYAELARSLGCAQGDRAPLGAVREAVLELRRGKGMVLDPTDHDTWSAGSFFTNPVLSAGAVAGFETRLPPETRYPHWPAGGGAVKLSAAWLIERAGFARGYRRGGAAVSGKHTLALTNTGRASTAELVALAREVRDGVRDRFGVTLQPEPRLVGVDW
ncbi:MAG: UDP-N-acetylmuramate dehydrogenase [Actinobacteria bacterium]|nr:UDP-N-acetylmuramate dehydrogenase [Actinomycetota bacterium]MBI3688833.1 UDP-N-acetylmuramate dehydrogenase [Actinomycetota bacterium]